MTSSIDQMNHAYRRRIHNIDMDDDDDSINFQDLYIRARASHTPVGAFLRNAPIVQCMMFGLPALLILCSPLVIPISAALMGLGSFGIFCVHFYLWYLNLVRAIKRFYRRLVRKVMYIIQTILSIWILLLNVVFLPFIISGIIRTHVNNIMDRLHQFRRNLFAVNIQTVFRTPFWIFHWMSTSVMADGKQRFDSARKRYVDEPVAHARRRMTQMYEFVDDLFGDFTVTVTSLRNRAEILVESYSRLPTDIIAVTVRDQIRSTIKLDLVRDWLRDNVEIPVYVVDNHRETKSLFALRVSDDVVSIRRCHSDSGLVRHR